MSSSKVSLSVPEGISQTDLRASYMVRAYFQFIKGMVLLVHGDGRVARLAQMYDRPQNGNCVWYEIVRATRRKYNPLWAIHYEGQAAIARNGDFEPYGFRETTKQGEYIAHGVRLYSHAVASVGTTFDTLLTRIPDLMSQLHLTGESALNMVRSEADLSPVHEAIWRDCRRLTVSSELLVRAKFAHATCPRLYDHPSYTAGLKRRFNLMELYEVENEPVVSSAAIDGLFIT